VPSGAPYIAHEVYLLQPDGSTETLHQWNALGTYTQNAYVPNGGVPETLATIMTLMHANAGGGVLQVGSGVGWTVNWTSGTLPVLGRLNVILDNNGFLTEEAHWLFQAQRSGAGVVDIARMDPNLGIDSLLGLFTFSSDGTAASAAAAGAAKMIYNDTRKTAQLSVDTGGYVDLLTGSAVANGGVTVTFGAATAPAGSSATPTRWLSVPDGAGGTFTMASFS
jgi:hypothetical protein